MVAGPEKGSSMFLGDVLPLVGVKPVGKNKAQALQFAAAFTKAVRAGLAAGSGSEPEPMVICEMSNPVSNSIADVKKMWVENEGACGFAWVNVNPGNSPFANWLKKNGYARKSYSGGVDIWISDFGQSVDRKSACADAMARVLQIELGLSGIYAASRLD
jgi:hypothetical protein